MIGIYCQQFYRKIDGDVRTSSAAAGAFFLGLPSTIPTDCVAPLGTLSDEEAAALQMREFESMKYLYGAKIVPSWRDV